MGSNESYRKKATCARKEGELENAGDYYTLSAYERLAKSEWNEYSVWAAPNTLLYASICYRMAGLDRQSLNRCHQGQLILEELRIRLESNPAWIGLTHEIGGDLQVIAGEEGSVQQYAEAKRHYEDVEAENTVNGVIGWLSEEGFHENIRLVFEIADAIEWSIPNEKKAEIRSRSPIKRIDFKTENLEEMVKSLFNEGQWP